MAEATRALGTQLLIGTQVVGNLTSIGGVEASAETIDVTALDSTGGYRKFLAGFKDAGEVSISGYFAPDDPGQAAMYAAFESGDTSAFKIKFPASMSAQWEFNGVVTAFSTSAELEEAVGFESTIKVSGEPVLNLNPTT
ncbi:phage tail tube protein [Paenibacillus thailandensis]|uniref:Phage tail tube protein n=1 Tax=Paenibacillus thailandensis TaxID=393250 RepID=A0ABW5QSV7_9BACL